MGWLCRNCDNSLNFSLLLPLQRVNARERRGDSNKKGRDTEMTLVWERYCSRPALLFHINTAYGILSVMISNKVLRFCQDITALDRGENVNSSTNFTQWGIIENTLVLQYVFNFSMTWELWHTVPEFSVMLLSWEWFKFEPKFEHETSFLTLTMQLFYGPLNERRDRALEARNSSLQELTWHLDGL